MFGLIWSRFRNSLYDRRILKSVRVPGFIISIGNITWGGTGKTSLVLQLTRYFLKERYRVAIVSRGYRRSSKGLKLVSDGTELKCTWEECGDEPFLLAAALPGAVVVVAEDRLEALQLLETILPDIILLDDAFQHRSVGRDIDIVMVDASEDITRQHVLPFGKLREEPASISRADAVILTHSQQIHPNTRRWFVQHFRKRLFHANYVAENPETIRGKNVGAFCGIGSPQHFFHLLEQNGANVVAKKSFRDHYPFSKPEIQQFREDSLEHNAEFVVTTAKDAIRLGPALGDPLFRVVNVKLEIEEEALFYQFVTERLKHRRLTSS
jgi:tetraacyldisaccharide 4'-kinase